MADLLLVVMTLTIFMWAGACSKFLGETVKHYRALSPLLEGRRKLSLLLDAHYDARWDASSVLLFGENSEMKNNHDARWDASSVLSPQEIAAARFLQRNLDAMILHYDQHKAEMFNLRKMRRMVKQDLEYYSEIKREVDAHLSEEAMSGKMAELYADFARASALAFVVYTPFIRTEIILRLLWADLAKPIAQIRREAGGEKFA